MGVIRFAECLQIKQKHALSSLHCLQQREEAIQLVLGGFIPVLGLKQQFHNCLHLLLVFGSEQRFIKRSVLVFVNAVVYLFDTQSIRVYFLRSAGDAVHEPERCGAADS